MSTDNRSQKEKLMDLPPEERTAFLKSLTDEEAEALLYDWQFNGRPKQLEGIIDNNWFMWLILAGRGFGKTRTGAELVRHWVENCGKRRIGIISPTTADLRDVIVEGESGIINIFPPWNRPVYEPTKRRVTWPNGAIASLYSGEEPERLRGPQHDAIWCLTGDTLVATQLGEVRIDQIDPSVHSVWTPWGYKKIYSRVCTNEKAEVHTAHLAFGKISGTLNHLVYDDGKFVPLGELKCATFVKNTTEESTTFESQDGTSSVEDGSLLWSILMRLEKFLPVTRYTIRTLTARTIQLKIWNASRQKNTTLNTPSKDHDKPKNDTRKLSQFLLCVFSAVKRMKRKLGQRRTPDSARRSALTSGGANRLLSVVAKLVGATCAGQSTSQKDRTKNTAQKRATVKQANLAEETFIRSPLRYVEKSPNLMPVYDIGVDGGVFLANGFIVHNCDELAGFSSPEIMQRAFDMAMFGLRLGTRPQIVMTTTPKPVPIIQTFIKKYKEQQGKNVDEGRIILTTGSSYENKSNLASTFFNQIVQYEGTVLGRQEIHAEVINLEEMGIIKRSWFKLWPNTNDMPRFDYIIQSYDSAFTEKTNNDPTACQTWGVFRPSADKPYCVMLLDAWTDHLKYPELRERAQKDFKEVRYGGNPNDPYDYGQAADLVLIEEKGSGITLIQDLERAGLPIRSYNPGRMDKVQRLHAISHLVANGRCYIPESTKVPGEFRTWATDFIAEICVFPNSLHDDQVDAFTQLMALLRDQSWLSIDIYEEEEDADYTKKKRRNPYSS